MAAEHREQAATERMIRYVAFLARFHGAIVLTGLLLFAAAIVVAARLQLRSDFTELLPQDDPELVQLRHIGDRVGAPSTLILAIRSDDVAANEHLAEALVHNLRPLVGTDLRAIDYRPDAPRPFFEQHRSLYADLRDLRRADDDLAKLIASRKNPAFVAFGDRDLDERDDDPLKDLQLLEKSIQDRSGSAAFPHGYYESEDGSLLAIVMWTRSSGTGDLSGFLIRDDVQRVVDATVPSRYGNVSVGITGDVESAIEEHDALKSDIESVSVVCMVLVLLVILAYYRSVLALAYVFFPTLLGVALAFAVTAVSIGYLNTNTAFLGSIILGNGINFAIILLARYREERVARPDGDVDNALAIALERTALPTLGAALAASIAYGSLALTAFRGFRQFGEVGGVGMILCWLMTYTYCPALISWSERTLRPRARGRTVASGPLMSLAAGVLRRPRALAAIVVGATCLSVWQLSPVLRSPFEYDFSKLRNQRSRKEGAGDLYVRVGRIFPQDLAPVGIALLPRADDAANYRRALLENDCLDALHRAGDPRAVDKARGAAECARRVAVGEPTGGLLSTIATAADFLPHDQQAKLALLTDIRRRLKDPALSDLSTADRAQIDRWAPPDNQVALTYSDLPEEIARRFRETDGTVGRVALIYPVRVWPNWDGHSLIRLSDVLKGVRLPNGQAVDAAGQPTLFAAMLRSIAHDGPLATEVALAGVVLMIILLFRKPRPVVVVLLSLVVGVVWMAGAGAALGLRLNFLNFVALPVTLGIGVDYAVNICARLLREPATGHVVALAETGSAVALCSLTTIIGYSSLLIASNGALRSFGKVADLGEVGCLLSALLIVPWLSRSSSPQDRDVVRP